MDAGAFYGIPGFLDFRSLELNPEGRGRHRSAAVEEISRSCFLELIGTLASTPQEAPVFHAIGLAPLSGRSGEKRANDAGHEDVEKLSGKTLDSSAELRSSLHAYTLQAGTAASSTHEEVGLPSEEPGNFSLSGAAGEEELAQTSAETAAAPLTELENSCLFGGIRGHSAAGEKQAAKANCGEREIPGEIVARATSGAPLPQADLSPIPSVNLAAIPAGDAASNPGLLEGTLGGESSSLKVNGDAKAAAEFSKAAMDRQPAEPARAGLTPGGTRAAESIADRKQVAAFAVRMRPASEIAAAARDGQPKTGSNGSSEVAAMKHPSKDTVRHNENPTVTPVSQMSAAMAAPADSGSRGAAMANYAPGPAADSPPPGQPVYTEAAALQLNDQQQLANEPVREIQVDIGDQAERVRLQLLDKTGELRVHVRTSDETLAASLQSDLKTLVRDLDRAGFEAETWTPSPVLREESTPEVDASAETSGERWQDRKDLDQDNTNRQPGERRHDKPSWPDWLDDFRQSFRSGGRK